MTLHEDITLGFIAGVLICVSVNAICAVVGRLNAGETQSDFESEVVTNEVANGVANNVANRVTTIETEVYRVVCVESADGYCKEYSVRRITRE